MRRPRAPFWGKENLQQRSAVFVRFAHRRWCISIRAVTRVFSLTSRARGSASRRSRTISTALLRLPHRGRARRLPGLDSAAPGSLLRSGQGDYTYARNGPCALARDNVEVAGARNTLQGSVVNAKVCRAVSPSPPVRPVARRGSTETTRHEWHGSGLHSPSIASRWESYCRTDIDPARTCPPYAR